MTEHNCPDCKDTKLYQGLNEVRPCPACCPSMAEQRRLIREAGESFYKKMLEIAENIDREYTDSRG